MWKSVLTPGDIVLIPALSNEEWLIEDVAFVKEISGTESVKFSSLATGALAYLVSNDIYKRWVWADSILSVKQNGQDTNEAGKDFFDGDLESPHLEELGKKMLGWLDGMPNRPDNEKLYEIVTYLLAIQYDKEGSYGSSWKGKGEYRGIIANIDRKYDRLDKIIESEIEGTRKPLPTKVYGKLTDEDMANIGESKIDSVADLAIYCLLYLSWLREHHPGAFRVWVENNIHPSIASNIYFIGKPYYKD